MFYDELTSNYPLTSINYFAIKDESNPKNMYCYESQKSMCRKLLGHPIFPMSAGTLLQIELFLFILYFLFYLKFISFHVGIWLIGLCSE